jgi:hypothetical protein
MNVLMANMQDISPPHLITLPSVLMTAGSMTLFLAASLIKPHSSAVLKFVRIAMVVMGCALLFSVLVLWIWTAKYYTDPSN